VSQLAFKLLEFMP